MGGQVLHDGQVWYLVHIGWAGRRVDARAGPQAEPGRTITRQQGGRVGWAGRCCMMGRWGFWCTMDGQAGRWAGRQAHRHNQAEQ